VVIDVPHGQQVTTELLRRDYLVDYRPAPHSGSTHFYSKDEELELTVREIKSILKRRPMSNTAQCRLIGGAIGIARVPDL
jgi:hypothetical protein